MSVGNQIAESWKKLRLKQASWRLWIFSQMLRCVCRFCLKTTIPYFQNQKSFFQEVCEAAGPGDGQWPGHADMDQLEKGSLYTGRHCLVHHGGVHHKCAGGRWQALQLQRWGLRSCWCQYYWQGGSFPAGYYSQAQAAFSRGSKSSEVILLREVYDTILVLLLAGNKVFFTPSCTLARTLTLSRLWLTRRWHGLRA